MFSASNLYGVPLGLMCKSTTGSDVLQEKEGFTVIIKDVLDQRKKCLGAGSQICMNPRQVWPMCDEIETCCKASGSGSSKSPWYVRGVCARPWLSGFSLSNTTGLSLMETMDLFTAVLGELVGVDKPYNYGLANSEFWCKNCPNNGLLHCPFNPNAADAAYSDCCAGGSVSKAGEAFWAMSPETQISGKYILCSDQAKVCKYGVLCVYIYAGGSVPNMIPPTNTNKANFKIQNSRFKMHILSNLTTVSFRAWIEALFPLSLY